MSVIDSTTGHSPREERKVAKLLYFALAGAVILGFLAAMMMSQHRKLNPTYSQPSSQMAPTAPAAAADEAGKGMSDSHMVPVPAQAKPATR